MAVASTSFWPSALRWGGLVFCVSAVACWAFLSWCTATLCGGTRVGGAVAGAVLALAAPLLLIAQKAPAPGAFSDLLILVLSASAPSGLLAGFGRFNWLRLRAYAAQPLPDGPLQPLPQHQYRVPAATGALPSVIAVILGDLVAFFIIVVRQGFTPQAWQQYAFVAGSVTALAIIPIYFEHRRAYAPNRVEVVLAWLWTTLRQLLGTAVAVMIVLFALANLRKGQWITGSFAALFGAGILWMAWFGGGYLRSFGDDRPAHLERKRRYGWK